MLRKLIKWLGPLTNPATTSGLDELVGTFSLHNAQLYVGTLHTDDGLPHKAIILDQASYEDGIFGLYFFSPVDAARMVAFLDAVLGADLPATFQFPRSENRLSPDAGQYEWTISKFEKEWHHGGGYKGKLAHSRGFIITKQSAERLRKCVAEFFG